jgi:hypothetical protein
MITSSTTVSAAQTIALVAADDGVIENINLYPGRAELTRIFKVFVQDGENHIDIHGLPISLVDDSLRLVKIHDGERVTLIFLLFLQN